MLSSRFKDRSTSLVNPIANFLIGIGLSPNMLTTLGLIMSIGVAVFLAKDSLIPALIFLLLTSFFDVMDGAVARVSNNTSRFGGYLDSLFDRYADAAILLGLAFYLGGYYALIFIVLVGSLLVSYSRSRAENFLPRCDVGIAERAERLIILILATLVEVLGVLPRGKAFFTALVILAVLTHLTVLQRTLYTKAKLR
jgi:phosphatidylglycerophosphate synthase